MRLARRWDARRWRLAHVIAWRLPACVVAQCVSRVVRETRDETRDDLSPLTEPVGLYTRRWADRHASCR